KTKTGICLLQDGNQEPFKVRLHLAKDILIIQEQDVICVSGEPFYSGERTVTIRRQTVGGFGLSIKGGAEHNIPVVVSKISKEQRAELSGLLFIGDAILQINGINVRKCRHEEVVQVLRNAGEEVTLTVSFLKRAPAFLKLPLNEDCACAPSDQSSGTSSPLCDSGLHLNYHPNNTVRQPRQNAFQVTAVDGVCSGIIQCLSTEDSFDWLQAIATNISNLTKHNIKKINRNFPVNQQIVYMGWCEVREQDSLQDRLYSPTFLALRGSSLYKFLAPPVTTWDWTRAEKTFSVYEIMCKILKFVFDYSKRFIEYLSLCNYDWYYTKHCLNYLAVTCKTYACVLESHLMGLTIDFSTGFICFDAATKAVLWRYKFSQLKGSSDDGKSKIKFLFQNPDTKQIEAKELEFSNLFAVLHCIHSFFAAKVACLDPLFLGNQATASAATSSATTSKAKYTT
uniref:Syntrophin gamma 1 n=1 Tax=Cavia porcellus TaxID=10141 RepID=A0A286X783_CAVPO